MLKVTSRRKVRVLQWVMVMSNLVPRTFPCTTSLWSLAEYKHGSRGGRPVGDMVTCRTSHRGGGGGGGALPTITIPVRTDRVNSSMLLWTINDIDAALWTLWPPENLDWNDKKGLWGSSSATGPMCLPYHLSIPDITTCNHITRPSPFHLCIYKYRIKD